MMAPMADTTDDPPPTTVQVLACADCGRLDRVDPLTLLASGSEPCPCACGGVNLLCQICGKVIGWGSTSTVGTIDLDELPDGVTGERYLDLFREDTYGQAPS